MLINDIHIHVTMSINVDLQNNLRLATKNGNSLL